MKNINKKIYIALGIILFISIIGVGSLSVSINGKKICKNTYVNNINIGNLTKTQAIEKLESLYKLSNIEFKYNNNTFKLDPNKINFNYDIDKTVDNAFSINRNGTFIENIKKTISSFIGKKNIINLSINYNEENLKSYIDSLAKKINVSVKNATISIQGSNIEIHKDEDGIELDKDKSVANSIKELERGNTTIELVVKNIQPNIKEENLVE